MEISIFQPGQPVFPGTLLPYNLRFMAENWGRNCWGYKASSCPERNLSQTHFCFQWPKSRGSKLENRFYVSCSCIVISVCYKFTNHFCTQMLWCVICCNGYLTSNVLQQFICGFLMSHLFSVWCASSNIHFNSASSGFCL